MLFVGNPVSATLSSSWQIIYTWCFRKPCRETNDRNILGKSFRLRCKVHPVRNRLGNRRRANSFCWRTSDRLISQHHLQLGHSNMEYLKSEPGRNIGRHSDHHSWRNSCNPRRNFIVLQTDVQADIRIRFFNAASPTAMTRQQPNSVMVQENRITPKPRFLFSLSETKKLQSSTSESHWQRQKRCSSQT